MLDTRSKIFSGKIPPLGYMTGNTERLYKNGVFCLLKIISVFLFVGACFAVRAQRAVIISGFERGALLLDSGGVIRSGNYLLAGKGKGENGWYRSLGFQSYLNLPYMLNRNVQLTSESTESGDMEFGRNSDIIASLVHAGDSLLIKKIKKVSYKDYGMSYVAVVQTVAFPKTRLSVNLDTTFFIVSCLLSARQGYQFFRN